MSEKIRVYEDAYGNMRTSSDTDLFSPNDTKYNLATVPKDSGEVIMPLVAPVEIHLPRVLIIPQELLPKRSDVCEVARETIIEIYQQLCHFAPLESALHYHGIKPSMFYKLMAWAAEHPESEWYAVLELMNRGFAQPMILSLNTIARASQTNWLASAWWIEKVAGIKPVVVTKTPTGSPDKDVEASRERSAEDIRSDILQRLTGIARALPVSVSPPSADDADTDNSDGG